jgi:predicted nuclease of predicted toxin-antitoxin system
MRFLVDECLSTGVAVLLTAAGHDTLHVLDVLPAGSTDEDVLRFADRESRVLVSADTDFGEILARSGDPAPSVILFRRGDRLPDSLAAVLLANLVEVTDDLAAGAIVVITDSRLRVRRLPVERDDRD